MRYVIGVDVGGTFTDAVAVDEEGNVTLAKSLSTPSDICKGVLNSVGLVAEQLQTDLPSFLARTYLFLHSTTVAENAIVNGELAKTGLITTRGFEDTLHIARGGYSRWSGLSEDERKDPVRQEKARPLIPLAMIKGVKERCDSDGRIIAGIEETETIRAATELLKDGAEVLGVSFLWSFQNPDNETAAKKVIKEFRPDLYLTLSNEVAPILGEYERTSTVVLNAGLGPLVSAYLGKLRGRLQENGFRGSILVMQSYGGLLSIEDTCARCVGLIESGPASGLLGSKAVGDLVGEKNVIAIDMGGTTFKAGIIKEGTIEYQREPLVFRYHYSVPKMDVVSLGVAGGSIISLDPRTGTPQIGPRSAGSDPGPVCYKLGGQEPTVADVDLILGYLNPEFFWGGRIRLDEKRAGEVFKARIAGPLGMDVAEAAGAINRLVNSRIYDMLHKLIVSRGVDPRKYALCSYGGTAGMHVAAFAPELGVSKIVIPHSAAVHGAFGLVSADAVFEEQTTRPIRAPGNLAEINGIFARLENKLVDQLRLAGFQGHDISLSRSIDMRFRRQVHLLSTPVVAANSLDETDLRQTLDLFVKLYQEKYGKDSAYAEAGIEMITFRARGVGKLKKPALRAHEIGKADPGAAFLRKTRAYFSKPDGMADAMAYDFNKLLPGSAISGPAIIWTPITTIVVNPGQRAVCDGYRNIVITWN
ncbi:MAG: hydantoinase/oxoprolinase family protein [Chloroflexi bacterium]|nr:hydantoinase/oxoprolinase family protein [Chloroflexota bacterium]